MKKITALLFVLTLAICVGIVGVAFATVPTVEINADIYYGEYTGDRNDVEGKATIAFANLANVTDEEYGIVVSTYGNEWSGTATSLKYYAKQNNDGKYGVAVYGLADGFYGLKAYVYDKDTETKIFSENEVKIAIGYSAVTLVRPEADDVVKYVKTGTAFADPAISGVDRWNTFDGTTYTTYDFDAVVEEDITLYGETITYEYSNTDPIVLYTDTSMSGASYSANEVDLPYIRVTSSLKGVQAQNAGWYPATGNPSVVIENGKIKATGKMSGKVVLKSGTTELDVTVKSPVLSAKDLDELSLVTFYGDVVASSEYYGKAQAYLDGHYELINDIDYATYERANDTAFATLTGHGIANVPDYGYMLPIATLPVSAIRGYAVNYGLYNGSNSIVTAGHHLGVTSPYSKTWLGLLSDYVEEVTTDYANGTATAKMYDMKIKAGVTSSGVAEPFMGINPKGRTFRGILDGASKTIKNAYLMLDNYMSSVGSETRPTLSMATGQFCHFVGLNSGTIENIVFDNIAMGGLADNYGYQIRNGMYSDNWGKSMYGLLGLQKVVTQGLAVAVSSGSIADKEDVKFYNAYTNNSSWQPESKVMTIALVTGNKKETNMAHANALIAMNSGTVQNVVMNYKSSGSAAMDRNTSFNANGLCWRNAGTGIISDVIINNQGYLGGVHGNAYTASPATNWYGESSKETRYIVSSINAGSITNTYVYCWQAVSSAPFTAGTGSTYDVTIVSTDGTNNVAGMDTTNCNDFIKNYVAGLNG